MVEQAGTSSRSAASRATMVEGLRHIDLDDPEWGKVKLLVAVPRPEESWGSLAPLRGTSWGDQIAVVPGEDLSHALHGWATPLMRSIGIKPEDHARKIPGGERWCPQRNDCLLSSEKCHPSPDVPDCYEPPGLTMQQSLLVTTVVLAWREGRYVLVVDGPEFSLS